MKILCTADIHIGRRASRIPQDINNERFSASSAWESIVECAIKQKVDALVLAGDIVDRENSYYEAFGPLESGLKRLEEHEIQTFAIAGNHDYDVLGRLVEYVKTDYFHLLGSNGEWQSYTLELSNKPSIQILGWSFPSQYVNYNPLKNIESVIDGNIPAIGLLHADLDQLNSPYAPVRTQDLVNQPVLMWVLGHTHHPQSSWQSGDSTLPVLIPGSPLAMDPGEPGAHGPWLVHIETNRIQEISQIPLSKVRYESLTVQLDGIDDQSAWEGLVPNAIREFYERNKGNLGDPLELIRFRIILEGRTKLHLQLPELTQRLEQDLKLFDGLASIEKVINHTQPDIDLNQLAASEDLPGLVAKILLDLQSGQETRYAALIQDGLEQMEQVYQSNSYREIVHHDDKPDTGMVRNNLIKQGYLLLDSLLSQKQEEAG